MNIYVKKSGDRGEEDQKRATRRQGHPGPEINPFGLGQKGIGGRSREKNATGGLVVFGYLCLLSILQVLRTLFSSWQGRLFLLCLSKNKELFPRNNPYRLPPWRAREVAYGDRLGNIRNDRVKCKGMDIRTKSGSSQQGRRGDGCWTATGQAPMGLVLIWRSQSDMRKERNHHSILMGSSVNYM